MARADDAALQRLLPLLRQLRGLTGLREDKPGIFYFKGAAFVHFHEEDGVLRADLKQTSGTGFDHYLVDTPAGQRKLFDEAKRRLMRHDED